MYKQESLQENKMHNILRDFEIQTNHQIPARRPDLVFFKYSTFDRLRKLREFQNRMHLCLKVNKRQRKCRMNCMSGMLEGRVTTRCLDLRKNYITAEDFDLGVGGELREKESGKRETRCHAVLGAGRGPDGLGVRVKKSLKCTKLAKSKVTMIPEENRNVFRRPL